jgi:tRNA-(ms[2]io[6]A)-hydroxylase
MLGLQSETNPEWAERVRQNIPLALIDHAHCEKKAALMAISLLNRYPEKHELVSEMTDLAVEEMSHFRMVIMKMKERSISFARDPGDNYAQVLHSRIRSKEPQRLLDTLLVSSLIEARSCERFRLLSELIRDNDLRQFYSSLLASEARHRNEFLRLAKLYFPHSEVNARLKELEEFESEIVGSLGTEATIHG